MLDAMAFADRRDTAAKRRTKTHKDTGQLSSR
jgi:hypothetical protein